LSAKLLTELELMGMVTRRPNRGAAVRDFTTVEVEQIYFVRELLERAAVEVMPLPAAAEVGKSSRGPACATLRGGPRPDICGRSFG
jgi:Mn-dependent DtxR family transcriptional regulator